MTRDDVISLLRQGGQSGTDAEVIEYLLLLVAHLQDAIDQIKNDYDDSVTGDQN
jgi:hypothetical protein